MLKLLELFGGIGAPRKALERLGIDFKTVDYVEINEHQCKLYNELYNENYEPQDITTWDKDIEVDMIFHGSPCQDFSMAGKRLGGDKGSGTRSSLLYETIRIVQKLKPKYIIWENVKGVIDDKNVHNFNNYIDELDKLGYVSNYKLTNAKYYGIPQARERVICVSILNGYKFVFQEESNISNNLEDYVDFRDKDDLTFNFFNRYKEKINKEATIEEFEYYINNLPILKGIGTKKMGLYDFGEMDTITMPNGITGTITCRNSQNYNKKYLVDNKLYKPSPKMCWKLMGFRDEDFNKVKDNQDKYLYNAAGNSIVVNVLEVIFKKLFKGDE